MNTKYSALALVAGVITSGLTFAEEDVSALDKNELSTFDEIVVTSSRVPIALRQVGISVSVLNAEDIESYGNFSLATMLRQMPGVNVASNGGAGSTTSLRIRGEESFRTLTIIDGIRIADPSGPQIATQMEQLLSSGLSRVEVLRGPQGLAFGADAGGVVNIFSPVLNSGMVFDAQAQTGAFDTQQYSVSFAAGNERGDVAISGVDFSTEGFNSRVNDSVLQDKDAYVNTTLHANLGWNISEQVRVQLTHRDIDSASEYDGCYDTITFQQLHACDADYELNSTRLGLEYTSDNLTHSLSYATAITKRENFSAGSSSFTAEGETSRWEYMGSLNSLPGANLVFGLDHEKDSNNRVSRNNLGAYLEYLSDFSQTVFLTAGLRYDDNDDFGQHNSYRITGAYLQTLDNAATLKYRASFGTGFRAPSPYEVAYNSGTYAYPPASLVSLQEETSEGYELAVEYLHDSLYLQAVYFDQEVVNAITFDLAGFSGYIQDNGESHSKGVELSGEYNLNHALTLKANYTYNETKMVSGHQGIRRPKHLANFGVQYSMLDQNLSLNAFYRLSRDTEDEVFGSRVSLDDFSVLDVNARYNLGSNITLFGRVENLLDERYEEVAGFFTAERAAYIGFSYHYR